MRKSIFENVQFLNEDSSSSYSSIYNKAPKTILLSGEEINNISKNIESISDSLYKFLSTKYNDDYDLYTSNVIEKSESWRIISIVLKNQKCKPNDEQRIKFINDFKIMTRYIKSILSEFNFNNHDNKFIYVNSNTHPYIQINISPESDYLALRIRVKKYTYVKEKTDL